MLFSRAVRSKMCHEIYILHLLLFSTLCMFLSLNIFPMIHSCMVLRLFHLFPYCSSPEEIKSFSIKGHGRSIDFRFSPLSPFMSDGATQCQVQSPVCLAVSTVLMDKTLHRRRSTARLLRHPAYRFSPHPVCAEADGSRRVKFGILYRHRTRRTKVTLLNNGDFAEPFNILPQGKRVKSKRQEKRVIRSPTQNTRSPSFTLMNQ